ncbi:hypothetical protein A2U01_0110592, partial [Trifolium medium]|nr:hypothetical protein [Trifolium medium]
WVWIIPLGALIAYRGKELLIDLWLDEIVLRFVLRRKTLDTQSALGGMRDHS